MHTYLTVITCIFLAACSKISSPLADEIDLFAASGVTEVKVFSLDSIPKDIANYETSDDLIRLYREVTDSHFCLYPITNVVVVKDSEKFKKIISSVANAVRSGASGYKCFEPHHGIQIIKKSATMEIVICYDCKLVQVHDGISQPRHDTTSESSMSLLDTALKSNH